MDVGLNVCIRMHRPYMVRNVMDLRARNYVTHPGLAHLGERFTSKSVREKLELFEAS